MPHSDEIPPPKFRPPKLKLRGLRASAVLYAKPDFERISAGLWKIRERNRGLVFRGRGRASSLVLRGEKKTSYEEFARIPFPGRFIPQLWFHAALPILGPRQIYCRRGNQTKCPRHTPDGFPSFKRARNANEWIPDFGCSTSQLKPGNCPEFVWDNEGYVNVKQASVNFITWFVGTFSYSFSNFLRWSL